MGISANTPKDRIEGNKKIDLIAGQKIAIRIDEVDDVDLVYTVPVDKKATIRVYLRGNEEDA